MKLTYFEQKDFQREIAEHLAAGNSIVTRTALSRIVDSLLDEGAVLDREISKRALRQAEIVLKGMNCSYNPLS